MFLSLFDWTIRSACLALGQALHSVPNATNPGTCINYAHGAWTWTWIFFCFSKSGLKLRTNRHMKYVCPPSESDSRATRN
ncbi:hypothetical protein C8J57DRAFT_1290611 [Mycena rebaudengoi]|nr:hypothetical protein C8J57DRAFT_1290611 [Mycena rebaudengoi]